jgi:spermidine synthase
MVGPRRANSVSAASALGMYFLSGACGLAVEQIFERLVTTVIGTSVEAAAIVLSVYFVALSLGAVFFRRFSLRVRSPLRVYGIAEVFAGMCALAIGLFFSNIQQISIAIMHAAGDHVALLPSARVAVAAMFIGPPAFAMGMTFPAMALFAQKQTDTSKFMSTLYAANVGGGVLAALACPYVLFPRFGMTGAALLSGGVQIAIGAVAFALAAARSDREMLALVQPDDGAAQRSFELAPLRLLFVLAAVSGAIVFAWEVLWVQLIGVTVGMSVYAFSMMLAVVLSGLFLGGSIVSALPKRCTGLPFIAAAFALSALACALQYGRWPKVPESLLQGAIDIRTYYPERWTFFAGERVRFQEAAFALGVPAIALGLVYPSLLRSPRIPKEHASRICALLGVVNAVGSCVGAMLTAHVLLPRLGSQNTYRALTLISCAVALGLTVVVFLKAEGARQRTACAGLGLCSLVGALSVSTAKAWDMLELTSGKHVYFRSMFVQSGSTLKFMHEDAIGGITTVVENRAGEQSSKVLLTNGKFQGNDSGETAAQTAFALLPLLMHEGRTRACVIGLGTGHSASVLQRAGFQRTDVIELAPGMIAAANAEFGALNHHVLSNPTVHTYVEDGRNRLLRDVAARYDIISIEISSIWFVGATNLYSREFYDLARMRLRPGGVLQQWVQLHHSSPKDFLSIVRTVRSAFPHVGVWFVGGQGVILASETELASSESATAAILNTEALTAERKSLAGLDLGRILGTPVFPPTSMAALLNYTSTLEVPINTDANRFLEYSSPRQNLDTRHSPEQLIAELRAAIALPPWQAPEAK